MGSDRQSEAWEACRPAGQVVGDIWRRYLGGEGVVVAKRRVLARIKREALKEGKGFNRGHLEQRADGRLEAVGP